MPYGFESGRTYSRRRDIHDRFEGQRQGGIITPASHPLIIIITGEEGLTHGYADQYRADGVFEYFGEGQIGDMVMARGNAAVLNHAEMGKDLLLFTNTGRGLRFEHEMICEGHHRRQAPDRNRIMRSAIVFELRPLESIRNSVEDIPTTADAAIDELRRRALSAASNSPEATRATRTVFERSRDVRDYVLARARGTCEGCGQPAPFLKRDQSPYLEPHHIRRLTDGGPDDPHFVIAVCPTCHRRVHHGIDGVEYNERLLKAMEGIEPPST